MRLFSGSLNSKIESKITLVANFDVVETNSVKKKAGTVEISVKALKNTTLQNSGSLGSVPEGFRPSHEVCLSAVAWTATGVPYSASVSIGTDGLIRFYQSGSNSRWLIFHTSYMV